MTPHSSTLAWKIPWMKEPGGLQSMGSLRDGHCFTFTFHFHALEKEMATHSSVLAWRIPGVGEPGGLLSVGLHRVGHDWSNLAAAAAATILNSTDNYKISIITERSIRHYCSRPFHIANPHIHFFHLCSSYSSAFFILTQTLSKFGLSFKTNLSWYIS